MDTFRVKNKKLHSKKAYLSALEVVVHYEGSFVWLWHDLFVNGTWLIRICDMTHSCWSTLEVIKHYEGPFVWLWHDSLVFVTWLIRICDTTHSCVNSELLCILKVFVCARDMARLVLSALEVVVHYEGLCLCVWHDSLVCVTLLVPICNMTHSYSRRHSALQRSLCVCDTWLTSICDNTRSYLWHNSVVLERSRSCCVLRKSLYVCVTWLARICDMTRSYVWQNSLLSVS